MRSKKPSETWIASLYILAFFRAAATFFFVLYALSSGSEVEMGTAQIDGASVLLDVGILTVLGIAAYKRQLWGAYGLVLFSMFDAGYKFMIGAHQGVFWGLLWVVLFTTGTIHLARLKATLNTTTKAKHVEKWVQASWITAFACAFLMFVLAIQQNIKPLTEVLFGFILIGLGINVYRGDHRLAWGLVAFQLFNTLAILSLHGISTMSVAMAIGSCAILVIYIAGAIQLRRAFFRGEIPEVAENLSWIRVLYEIAFLHATATTVIILISLRSPTSALREYVDLSNLIDVAILITLGFAAYKRKMWGAYGLIVFQVLGIIFIMSGYFSSGAITAQAIVIQLSILLLYVMGTIHLRRLKAVERISLTARDQDHGTTALQEKPPSYLFTYMCPGCHSFERSDTATCIRCGAVNPHHVSVKP